MSIDIRIDSSKFPPSLQFTLVKLVGPARLRGGDRDGYLLAFLGQRRIASRHYDVS